MIFFVDICSFLVYIITKENVYLNWGEQLSSQVTMHDVADFCGVSIATVSRIINNIDYPVSDELRARVLNAVKELGYTPNLIGKFLKTSKTNDIGVIIPTISNFYYSILLSGISESLLKIGFNMLLCSSNRNPADEKNAFISLLQKQVRGIIIASVNIDTRFIKDLIANDVTIAAVEQPVDTPSHFVGFDYYKGGYLAAKHLIEAGHRKIAYLSFPVTYKSRQLRYDGFMRCLSDNDITIPKQYIQIIDYERDSENTYEFSTGRTLAKRILELDDRPTAIFCLNDMMAMGAMQEITANGLKIPDDISVVGFDNLPISEMLSPALTTIDQCAYQLGCRAVELLSKSLHHPEAPFESVMFEPTLVERQSVIRR